MKRLAGLTTVVLFAVLYCAGNTSAAQNSYEIDLKELRPAPPAPTKSRNRTTRKNQTPAPQPAETGATDKTSSYIIKPGDHLFLILMRHYGLSNDAAERLIPEVMRLNGISNPRGLVVGHRLTIPLLPLKDDDQKSAAKKSPQDAPVQASQSTESPQSIEKPRPSAKIRKDPTPAKSDERQVTISVAPPCVLARTVIEHLGLLTTQLKLQPSTGFTAGTPDHRLVVACNLTQDEAYTYSRLLSMHNARLFVFKGDESPKHVIEALAGQLRFSFRMADPAAPDTLPLTYVFPAKGPYDQDVRLTIGSAANGDTSRGR